MIPTDSKTPYHAELLSLLIASTLTPGSYIPTLPVRQRKHVGVFVGDEPVVLCGPHHDETSVAQANALAASSLAKDSFRAAGHVGQVCTGVISGSRIKWEASMSAIVAKDAGQFEDGTGVGELVAIVLNDPHIALATSLCVTTETARALDPDAPVLDDGYHLGILARAAG